ncbi:hypothetical protein MGALJ_48530 [Mycobacterium gallinarum]|uniref:Uncharacterized protein n=1 Tax=Mycobacterium gallinarum TaxID=39689 RepID=A0A9W4FHH9_9MYCO|nr:hypothetical protein [Mycobacterium gallinarum]BBY95184.1 hypothetical protein MGALJ_48530 [Mycobacterium gallinarum]
MTDRPVIEAYRGALDQPCPTCGAEPGDFCTRTDTNRKPRIRQMPCVRRCPPSSRSAVEEPRRPYRSFSEPLRGDRDDEAST